MVSLLDRRRPLRALRTAAVALAVTASLTATAGCSDDRTGGEGPADGVAATLGPVEVRLPPGLDVLLRPSSPTSDTYVASSDPEGTGTAPRVTVKVYAEEDTTPESAAESNTRLLRTGYGGNAEFDRDEAVDVTGSGDAWRIGFTRRIHEVTYREGWLWARHGDDIVLVIAKAPEDEYAALDLDAVLDSVVLP